MVAGIVLVGTSILVLSIVTMIIAGAQADESNPLYFLASLFSGFIQSIEQRHQEATQYKESLSLDEAITESLPELKDSPSFDTPQDFADGITQSKTEDKAIRNDFIQIQEPVPEAETLVEPEETSYFLIPGNGGGPTAKPAASYPKPISITGYFDEENQSWAMIVSGIGFTPNYTFMIIISTADTKPRTIASFEVQTDSNGNFDYSPGILYQNLETNLYQIKILAESVLILSEEINFDTFAEDVITWQLNPVSLMAGESTTLQVFGQVNLDGPYFQNPVMIIEGEDQTESILLIVKADGKLYGTKELTFNQPETLTVKVFYDTLVREGTFLVSP
jgi:hypothetical protein